VVRTEGLASVADVPSRRIHLTAPLLAFGLLTAGCSSSTSTTPTAPTSSVASTAGADTAAPATSDAPTNPPSGTSCVAPTTTTPIDAKDLGNQRDWSITSFDGTILRAHWFPHAGSSAANPAPTLLMGPGWGGAGDTNTSAPGLLGAVSIDTLTGHGYNVLTWDPRGFGASTGNAEVDKPQFEGRDVQQLIDWVATLPGVQLDGPRDPRMGMVGGSYGGGIQFATAAQDCRVDALVPVMAWHSLLTSLYKANTPKLGWATLLMLAATGARLDPIIPAANASAKANGTFPSGATDFFGASGPGDDIAKVKVPTLIVQGTVDTLFSLDEAVSNFTALQRAGTKVAMVWYCGGHGVCLTKAGNADLVGTNATAWLDRYVKGDTSAKELPVFQFIDQDGTLYSAPAFPGTQGGTATIGTPVTASGSGSLQLVADGGAGPSTAKPTGGGIVARIALGITPAKATNAVNVSITAPSAEVLLVGAPQLHLAYSGTSTPGDRPSTVFAQLVDDSTGLVLGNQITPLPVTLDGAPHELNVPLEMIAHRFAPGATLTLQLVATTVAYVQPRLGGTVTFSKIDVSLPVISGAIKAS
jgi:ABC-2 type transport system ATP-binding protein